ncbi:hypothetical protein MKQ68_13115 [Chitinophaga horti]|uniref:Polyketide cyclase / dehydrase and lipid transport n=1 Tax=Chitinophaga horti TaxID=2920382 RepID=A0ABY6IY66_9BACT|nr:hypothetical protein [Chitinophaga horti]UYQ91034.1 hypothetical protein MKQ68_13115 [Chitinophaga horti]
MQRAGVINTTPEVVFEQLADTANWKHWYPWPVSQDPQHGRLVLKEVVADSLVTYEVLSTDERLNLKGSIYLSYDGNNTTINWSISRHVGVLPWWKVRGLLMDKIYGPVMEQGLTDLKKVSEASAAIK